MTTEQLVVLGATGSIGTQTLEVIRAENERAPGSYVVTGISVGSSVDAVLAHLAG